jgi:hypothetical protein
MSLGRMNSGNSEAGVRKDDVQEIPCCGFVLDHITNDGGTPIE